MTTLIPTKADGEEEIPAVEAEVLETKEEIVVETPAEEPKVEEEVTPAPEEEISPEAQKAQDEWDDLLEEDIDLDDVPAEETPEEVKLVTEEDEKEVVPEVETPPEPEPVAEIPPVVEPPKSEEVPATEEVKPEKTAEEMAEIRQTARVAATTELAGKFKLSDEQVEKWATAPNEVIPEMLANMYVNIYESIMGGMLQQLPTMISSSVQQSTVQEKAETQFYDAWPQLAKHKAIVERIAANYGTVNPGMSLEDSIKEIGAQAWVAARLPLDELIAHTAPAADAPAPPPPAPKGRVPASAGNVANAGNPKPAPALNDFELLADELINDDF